MKHYLFNHSHRHIMKHDLILGTGHIMHKKHHIATHHTHAGSLTGGSLTGGKVQHNQHKKKLPTIKLRF